MRRFLKLSCLLTALLGLIACVDPLHSQQPSAKWTTGFWLWEGASPAASWSGEPLDLLFVQVGSIKKNLASAYSREGWQVYGNLPDELPAAKEYWLVFRFDQQGVPDLQVVSLIARELQILQTEALRRHIKVAGVQLDIDSPTASLSQYASFLHEVRKAIPQDFQISITALLDWFRNGTAISEVIKEVDEFVPQFYDVAEPERYRSDSVIAAKIDAAKWAPVFNRFRKRFRVGISSFGRVQMVSASGSRTHLYGDVTPLDIANNSTMVLNASRNRAMELVLNYRASRKTRIGNNDFDAGDTVRFTLSTPEAIQTAMESVRQMRGYLAGVVFFRWPGPYEALVMRPEEVLVAAGLASKDGQAQNRIQAVDGYCAVVKCVDLYLDSATPFHPKPIKYHINSTTSLEYFLPEANVPAHINSAAQIELFLPAYCARLHLYIGRAVSIDHAQFTVELVP